MLASIPPSTAELMKNIDEEWKALMKVVDRLTPEQMTTPDPGGWSPKDNLAHLAAWLHMMIDSYIHKMPDYQVMGIEAEQYKKLDMNGINAVLFERNRNRSAADVLNELKSTYAEALQAIQGVPYADLLKPLRASGPERLIDEVIWNTSDHFREHRQTIERAL